MTGRAMPLGDGFQQWYLADAAVGLHRATRIEMASGRRVEGACDLAMRLGARHPGIGSVEGIGDRGDEGAGVGMARILEDLLPAALLDDAAEIHDGDAVADMLDHAEVVAD